MRVSLRAILRGNRSSGEQPIRLIPWEEVKAEHEARLLRHAARPATLRAAIETWWWCRRATRDLSHPPAWRLQWNWQRMRRGWSDRDTWNLDAYLAQWHDILTRIATPLSHDPDRIIDSETLDQWCDRQEHELAQQWEAIRLLADWFHHLWD